jgi:glycosyltransferase involved in cell wall biosynthesis
MSKSIDQSEHSVAVVSIYPAKGTLHPEEGGVASYTQNLCRALAESGDDVTVVCNIADHDKPSSYDEHGVHVRRTFRKNLGFFLDIAWALRKLKTRTVHFQQELALYGGIVSAFLLPLAIKFSGSGKRKVVTLHAVVGQSQVTPSFVQENNSNAPVFAVKAAFRILYTLLNWSADHIIVHEAPFQKRLIEEYHVRPAKVSVIPHGIEVAERMDEDKARGLLDIPTDKNVLLFVGYLTGYKGIDLLIEGYARYLRDYPENNALLLIGAGKHPKLKNDPEYLRGSYDRLKNKAAELLPAESYRWVGFVAESELQAYYSASDMSIYPYTVAMSSSGPMAMSIAYRTPFIASEVFSEYFDIKDHIFERTDVGLASTIERVLTHSQTDDIIETLRSERAWPTVAIKHSQVYHAESEA